MTHYTLSANSNCDKLSGRVLALGSFDGFHIGHRAVIDAAVSLADELAAEPAVFCFDIPPACFAPGSDIKVLGDKEERKYWRKLKKANKIPDIYLSPKELNDRLKENVKNGGIKNAR